MNNWMIETLFPDYFRYLWKKVEGRKQELQEIRIRVQKPITVWIKGKEYFLDTQGELRERNENGYIATGKDVENILNHLCQYSLYAYEEEIRQGYFTIQGGHRVGVVGQVVLEKERIKGMKYISSMNIRIAHEIKGTADSVLPYLYHENDIYNTMIISNPGCGKTTLLRDIVRQVSNGTQYGSGRTVGVVDERSEIGGSFMGTPQNDIGIRTDILDACPKVMGMMMMIRSMSPRVIAVDEIGNTEDIHALRNALQCGCRLIVTVHGDSWEEVKAKKVLSEILQEHMFERFILLGKREKACRIEKIIDESGMMICNGY